METLTTGLHIFFLLALAGTILRLIKPVTALWFLDRFNSFSVVKYYGLTAVIFYVLKRIITSL